MLLNFQPLLENIKIMKKLSFRDNSIKLLWFDTGYIFAHVRFEEFMSAVMAPNSKTWNISGFH